MKSSGNRSLLRPVRIFLVEPAAVALPVLVDGLAVDGQAIRKTPQARQAHADRLVTVDITLPERGVVDPPVEVPIVEDTADCALASA